MPNNSLSSHKNIEPESGVLYIVGTPIGNLSDLYQEPNILKCIFNFLRRHRTNKKDNEQIDFK